ncbi:hypothetical protein CO725_13700 [Vibrio parahaemolyticus]|uniref:DUF4234 domain-containing protein n=1 Tax=Vibrio parahaemolyticus TaxID=670 RepID=UPI000BE33ECB|nr:DUF4234 domain-containing protein [Vibrio parahaemolyticus]ATI48764.1 hypothetical protein CO725_13700 [Vibrio parahaemolyticus]
MKTNKLKAKVNTKTLNFVLLSIVTLGIFNIMWLFKNNNIIEDILEEKIFDNRIIIVLATIIGWSSVFSSEPDLVVISGLLSFTSGIFYIVWAFKAKKALQKMMLNDHKIDYTMNSFYTFFFNVYYINFCINELEDEVAKSNVLSEKATV